ncbi:MAG: recombinase family protein [Rufibacter sp.]
MVPVAIFVRVSSSRQDYERQIRDLQAVADQKQYQVVEVITEVGSASKRLRVQRPELQRLLELARAGTIQKILVTEISRLGRKPAETIKLVDQLSELKVSVFTKNIGIETLMDDGTRSFAAAIIIAVLAEVARGETEFLSDRIRSGQQHAKSKGKNIARPTGTTKSKEKLLEENPKVVKYLNEGLTIREVAKLADVSPPTVMKIKKILEKKT